MKCITGTLTERDYRYFIQEAEITARVKHPHCISLLAISEDRFSPLLLTEWLDGGSVFDMLGPSDPPPPHVRLRIACDIASGVEYLHESHITHGDLKSLNVMLSADLVAKMVDLGSSIQSCLTAAADGGENIRAALNWLAPELVSDGSKPNFSTDMYALGVIKLLFTAFLALAYWRAGGDRPEIPEHPTPGFPSCQRKMC
jgi:serine/threonine protein kinase